MTITPSPIPNQLVTSSGLIVQLMDLVIPPWDMETTAVIEFDTPLADTVKILSSFGQIVNDTAVNIFPFAGSIVQLASTSTTMSVVYYQHTGLWGIQLSLSPVVPAGNYLSSTATNRGAMHLIYVA